jgi:hypothetical protein
MKRILWLARSGTDSAQLFGRRPKIAKMKAVVGVAGTPCNGSSRDCSFGPGCPYLLGEVKAQPARIEYSGPVRYSFCEEGLAEIGINIAPDQLLKLTIDIQPAGPTRSKA